MVTRYDLGWREHEIEASPTGNYVKHMDYAELEMRLLALPSDRVRISVIQAVEDQEARARVDQAAENLMKQDPKDLEDDYE